MTSELDDLTLEEYLNQLPDSDKKLIEGSGFSLTHDKLLSMDNDALNEFKARVSDNNNLIEEQKSKTLEIIAKIVELHVWATVLERAKANSFFTNPVKDGNGNGRDSSKDAGKANNNNNEKKASLEITSVSQAARMNSGIVKVQGVISAMFKLNKLHKGATSECMKCHAIYEHSFVNGYGKPRLYSDKDKLEARCSGSCTADGCDGSKFIKTWEYCNGILIELRDSENLSDIDPLKAILLDDDTVNAYMHLGETVTVTGFLDVISESKRISTSHMYIDGIEYETSNELIISPKDVEGIKRLVKTKGNGLVDFLAEKMFATDIIGYNYVKKGILLIAASTNLDINDKKLNALLIGDPGLAKSELLRKAITLVINSRYESAQNSSGISLTAIVEKVNETSVLRIGVIPAAKGAICALNEIGRWIPINKNIY
jgi:DNA replicative helicase MCM subunit Mcm2 (Cdc46/Mcm family)